MRCFVATVLGTMALSASVAHAADLPVKAPPVHEAPTVAAYNWTGWYVGGHGGYGWGTGDTSIGWTDPGNAAAIAAAVAAGIIPVSFSPDANGALGGFQLGYNYQASPNWLVGAETDFSFSDIKGSQTIYTITAGVPTTLTNIASQKLEWFGTIRGRVGYTAQNWLYYATAGGAYGHVVYSYSQSAPPVGINFVGTDSETEWGWTVGGGIEYGWARWTLRAEYLYIDLGSHSFDVPTNFQPASFFTPNFENKYHIVRAALNYRF